MAKLSNAQLHRMENTRLITKQGITALKKANLNPLQTRLTIRSMELGVPFTRAKNRALRSHA